MLNKYVLYYNTEGTLIKKLKIDSCEGALQRYEYLNKLSIIEPYELPCHICTACQTMEWVALGYGYVKMDQDNES